MPRSVRPLAALARLPAGGWSHDNTDYTSTVNTCSMKIKFGCGDKIGSSHDQHVTPSYALHLRCVLASEVRVRGNWLRPRCETLAAEAEIVASHLRMLQSPQTDFGDAEKEGLGRGENRAYCVYDGKQKHLV